MTWCGPQTATAEKDGINHAVVSAARARTHKHMYMLIHVANKGKTGKDASPKIHSLQSSAHILTQNTNHRQ